MTERVCIVGLGYVGLPLAIALARRNEAVGFDIDEARISELGRGVDHTGEVSGEALRSTRLKLTSDPAGIAGSDIYIITVPTPVDEANRPDLTLVKRACQTVGRAIRSGAIVVVESTVYPGVTEDICGPELAKASGLVCGRDFYLGYSPERINPGDREHTIDRICKVVSGQTPEVAQRLAAMYGDITAGGAFVARSIKTAEAAKVIENAQRDINIAFINEVTMIFNRMGMSVYDVLEASKTKWNFLPFTPGLVGGHCIGVDPFYLADCAERLGQHPEVILAGRRINDAMGSYVAAAIAQTLARDGRRDGVRVLVLGLTFKENVPDLRNSKVIDVVRGLAGMGYHVDVHDPVADREEAKQEYGVDLLSTMDSVEPYDCLVGAVIHENYKALTPDRIAALVKPKGLIADIKGMWRNVSFPDGYVRWQL